jgi:hypothetical protein
MKNSAHSRQQTVDWKADGDGKCPIIPATKNGFVMRASQTAGPVMTGNVTGREPEFVRVPDLRLLAGLKRGFVYGKIKDGTFRSISLREPGNKFGVRLVYWPSVKNWLLSLLAKQNPDNT